MNTAALVIASLAAAHVGLFGLAWLLLTGWRLRHLARPHEQGPGQGGSAEPTTTSSETCSPSSGSSMNRCS
jgi:hypothetical protein